MMASSLEQYQEVDGMLLGRKKLVVCVYSTIVFTLSSCEQPVQKRIYNEVAVRDPHQLLQEMIARGEDPHAFLKNHPSSQPMPFSFSEQESPVTWSVPSGWKEKAASGMRLASFTSEMDSNLDVSIVLLSGVAGGVSANIQRWMNQIHLPPLNEEAMNQFLSKQEQFTTASGLSGMMVDFFPLLPRDDPSLTSILAAIIQRSDQTIFVKMTGTLEEINKNRAPFKDLCRSLRVKE